MTKIYLWFVALILVPFIALVRVSPALAHGVVGDYTFLEPIVADDANPKNEFDILKPQWTRTADGRQFSMGFSFEKVLVPEPESISGGSAGGGLVSIEIASQWTYVSPTEGRPLSGFGDLELLPKWAFLTVPQHELRLSLGARIVVPIGNSSVESQTHTQIGPEFLWAKGFGDLPHDSFLRYLRPFAIQGDYGYAPALGGPTYHEMFADDVIEYSLPYLSNDVRDIGLRWPVRNMYLYTEFNYDQLVTGPTRQTFPQVFVTPGIAYMDYRLELSLATQFAVNRATVRNSHAAILFLLDLFIDDLVPQTNWTPFS